MESYLAIHSLSPFDSLTPVTLAVQELCWECAGLESIDTARNPFGNRVGTIMTLASEMTLEMVTARGIAPSLQLTF